MRWTGILLLFLLSVSPAVWAQRPIPNAAPPKIDQEKPETDKPDSDKASDAPKPAGLKEPDKEAAEVKPPAPAAHVDPNVYVIGPEDVLYVSVYRQQAISGVVDVRPDGYISMQLIGDVKAAGLTPQGLAAAVGEKLKEHYKHPEVSIQVVKVLSKKYYIQGEVRRSGAYALTVPTTVLEALVNAGGFNDFANIKKIYILRGSKRFNFNYKDVSHGKRMEQNIKVENGDQIFVP